MPQSSVGTHHSDNEWRVEVFRLTAFFPQNHVDPSSWWEKVVGEAPENQNIQPKLGSRQEFGQYKAGRLILTALPGRADWLFLPAFDAETGAPAFDKLRSYNSVLGIFVELVEKWLNISPPLSRLAFGSILDAPVGDRPIGYRQLAKYLPHIEIDYEHSQDFLYQINRRRPSKKIPGLTINRLSKWAVAVASFSQIETGAARREYIISGNQMLFARLELDINTDQEYQATIQPQQTSAIFSELVELATELSVEGDIP